MNFFGAQKLQDDVFCLTQERDFFQSRYLEQVSQIQDMNQKMEAYRKEIDRLRQELLNQSTTIEEGEEKKTEDVSEVLQALTIVPDEGALQAPLDELDGSNDEEKKESDDESEEEERENESEEEESDEEGEVEDDVEEDTEANDIRQNAAKLLQWADYRTTSRTSLSAQKESEKEEGSEDTESFSQSDQSVDSIESRDDARKEHVGGVY
jgi:hypothetical protein